MDASQRVPLDFRRAVRRSDEIAREPLFPRCPIGWENFVPSGWVVPLGQSLVSVSVPAANKAESQPRFSNTGRLPDSAAEGTSVRGPVLPGSTDAESTLSVCTVLASRLLVDSLPIVVLDTAERGGRFGRPGFRKPKPAEIYLVEWMRPCTLDDFTCNGLVNIGSGMPGMTWGSGGGTGSPRAQGTASPSTERATSQRMKLTWVTISVLECFGNEALEYFRKRQQAAETVAALRKPDVGIMPSKRYTRYRSLD
jgi:hypothetical protein